MNDRCDDDGAISRLLFRYARAVDTKDWELYRSVFTDDAVIDYSSNGIPARDEITDFLSRAFTAIPMSMHYVTNVEADDWRNRHLREECVWSIHSPAARLSP